MSVVPKVAPASLIAHRGAPAYAPENTLPAIDAAVAHGASWIEVDVKLTRDNKLVIIHDDTVNRTTNGRGPVSLKTFAEIRELDAGSWFSPEFTGVKIPTLEEVVNRVLDLDVGFHLELKLTSGFDVETAEIALAALSQMWPKNRGRLYISSFSVRTLRAARCLMPELPLAISTFAVPRDPAALLAEYDCQILHVVDEWVDGENLERLQQSGVDFGVATINDPERARYLLAAGAQSITTDIPDFLELNPVEAIA